MPQTSNGANGNPWIEYMRAFAANYRAGHTQHHSVPGKEGRPAPVQRRVTGKQPESTNNSGKSVSAKSTVPKGQGKAPVKRRVTGKQPARQF